MLGTNGGGFFNVNSAHPFENPTGFTNLLEMLSVLVIPAALVFTYGRMAGNRRQGYAIYSTMMVMFLGAVVVAYIAEAHGSPAQHAVGLHTGVIPGSTGGNLEGKEQRFGIAGSALFDVDHHGHLVRRGQQRDRVVHRDRRRGAVRQPERVGGHLRRRRHRPVLDPALRPAGRVHRRPDGRPHPRVPGQEDRGPRDQARHPRPAHHPAGGPVRDRPGHRQPRRTGVRCRPWPPDHSSSRRPSTPTSARPTTTARRSPATPATSSPTPATSAPMASSSPISPAA